MKHEDTLEDVYHFTCGQCQLWWSWASTPPQWSISHDKPLWCPHCGFKNTLKIKDGFIEEKT